MLLKTALCASRNERDVVSNLTDYVLWLLQPISIQGQS